MPKREVSLLNQATSLIVTISPFQIIRRICVFKCKAIFVVIDHITAPLQTQPASVSDERVKPDGFSFEPKHSLFRFKFMGQT